MFQIIKAYLQFLYSSKNEHGIHSPFVFNLVTKCFYIYTDFEQYKILKSYWKPYSQNFYPKGINLKQTKLLFRMVSYFQPNDILEIKSVALLSTNALFLGNTNAKVCVMENDKTQFEFSNYLKSIQPKNKLFDLIIFNGFISEKSILNYFECLLLTKHNNSVWVFPKIHSNLETEKAWIVIKNHPKVTVTIDTFELGIVFFRIEQQKEHFKIRI